MTGGGQPGGYSGALTFSGITQNIEVTLPAGQLCHYITDEELDALGEMRKEPVMEMFLLASGVFFGALIPALEQLSRFNDRTAPMASLGLVVCFIAAMSLAISVVTGFLWWKRSKVHRSLRDTIRARAKVPVQHS